MIMETGLQATNQNPEGMAFSTVRCMLSAPMIKTEKTMKCIICHGDDIENADVKEEIKIDADIVCIPIRIPVCRTCGERYYDRRTIRFLEKVENDLKKEKSNLREVGKVLIYG